MAPDSGAAARRRRRRVSVKNRFNWLTRAGQQGRELYNRCRQVLLKTGTIVAMKKIAKLCISLFVFGALAACMQQQQATAPMPQKSLYERLGGQPAIVAVVDDFVANVSADARING